MSFTSKPIWYLNSCTRCGWAGSGPPGFAWLLQKSHSKHRAASIASGEAWPCFRILTRSEFGGCAIYLWRHLRTSCSSASLGLFTALTSFHWSRGNESSTMATTGASRKAERTHSSTARTNSGEYAPAKALTLGIPGALVTCMLRIIFSGPSLASCFMSSLEARSRALLRIKRSLCGRRRPYLHMWSLTVKCFLHRAYISSWDYVRAPVGCSKTAWPPRATCIRNSLQHQRMKLRLRLFNRRYSHFSNLVAFKLNQPPSWVHGGDNTSKSGELYIDQIFFHKLSIPCSWKVKTGFEIIRSGF